MSGSKPASMNFRLAFDLTRLSLSHWPGARYPAFFTLVCVEPTPMAELSAPLPWRGADASIEFQGAQRSKSCPGEASSIYIYIYIYIYIG